MIDLERMRNNLRGRSPESLRAVRGRAFKVDHEMHTRYQDLFTGRDTRVRLMKGMGNCTDLRFAVWEGANRESAKKS